MKAVNSIAFAKLIILSTTMVSCLSAQSQENVSGGFSGVEEVIVTATKRSESKQDIPIAISVVGSEEITNSSSNNIKDIVALIPNMTFEAGNNSATADISIRGIYNQVQAGAIGYESGLSVYVDGVSTGNQFNANQNLGEIERVEVLRGPQGTLFGKNSIAGAINIITKKPTDEFAGRASFELGDRSLQHFQGNLNIPLSDDLSLRISMGDRSKDGFVDNITLGEEDYAGTIDETSGRIQVRWTPSDNTTIDLSSDYLEVDLIDYVYEYIEGSEQYAGMPPAGSPMTAMSFDGVKYTQANGFANTTSKELSGTSLSIEHTLGNGFTITSLTGMRDDEMTFQADIDGQPMTFMDGVFPMTSEQITQELRIASPADGAYDFVAGLYYFDSEQHSYQNLTIGQAFAAGLDQMFPEPMRGFLGGYTAEQHMQVDTQSIAAFAHVNYHISDDLIAFMGLRYTDETKAYTAFPCVSDSPLNMPCNVFAGQGVSERTEAADKLTTSEPSWTVGLRRNIDEDSMLYGTVSQGIKTAAFNSLYSQDPAISLAAGTLVADAEFVTSYEIGYKSRLMDDRIEINLAAFYMDYEDMQVSTTDMTAAVPLLQLSNAAAATSQGFEVELRAMPTENLLIIAGLGVVDATYDEYTGVTDNKLDTLVDASGNTIPLAADITFNGAIQYTRPLAGGTLISRLDGSYIDSRYAVAGVVNSNDQLLDSQMLFNVRLGYRLNDSNTAISLWVKNLTDDNSLTYKDYGGQNFGAPGIHGMHIHPRSYGASVDYSF